MMLVYVYSGVGAGVETAAGKLHGQSLVGQLCPARPGQAVLTPLLPRLLLSDVLRSRPADSLATLLAAVFLHVRPPLHACSTYVRPLLHRFGCDSVIHSCRPVVRSHRVVRGSSFFNPTHAVVKILTQDPNQSTTQPNPENNKKQNFCYKKYNFSHIVSPTHRNHNW